MPALKLLAAVPSRFLSYARPLLSNQGNSAKYAPALESAARAS